MIALRFRRLIQERSFGNPGWIESYLLSLMQSGSLIIMNIRKRKAEETGYVLPPIAMLERSTFNYIHFRIYISI